MSRSGMGRSWSGTGRGPCQHRRLLRRIRRWNGCRAVCKHDGRRPAVRHLPFPLARPSLAAPGLDTRLRIAALKVFDDGHGPGSGAGGEVLVRLRLREHRGSSGGAWSHVGAGVEGAVNALAVFDDGFGPKLYAAGVITSAGGLPASRIACWDGTGAGCGGGRHWRRRGPDSRGLRCRRAGPGTSGVVRGGAVHAGGWVRDAQYRPWLCARVCGIQL